MGIGTSLGAYYETELDHHAGNEYIPPVKEPVISDLKGA